MPNMVLGRNALLSSTLGQQINFRKGVPVWVPPPLVKQALAMGAEAEIAGTIVEEPEEVGVVIPTDPLERAELIKKAFVTMTSRDQRGDFTAAGVPHTRALAELLGWQVDARERDDVWLQWYQEKENAE